MNTTTRTLSVLVLAVGIAGSAFVTRTIARDKDVPMTLTGCVVAGEEPGTFMVTNVVAEGLGPTNAFYRLDSSKDLARQVGHRVEIKGKADLGDFDKGKMRVKTDDNKVTTEVKADGKKVKVEESIWAGTMGSRKINADIATYGFEVKSVKRLEGNCMK